MRFRRDKLADELDKFTRSDISLVSQVIGLIGLARSDGLPVSPEELPICIGAANLHADTVAAMPARSLAERVPPRVAHLLERPDPETDYRTTIEHTVRGMFWRGHAPWLLDRPAPFTSTLTPLDPALCSYDTISGDWNVNGTNVPGELIYSVDLMSGEPGRMNPLGESPLKRCWHPLSMYGYAYRYLIDYFAQGGNPSSILKSSHVLGNVPDADGVTPAGKIVGEWVTARQERRPAVMDPTISLEVPASTGEIAATLSVLDHGAAEVARLLNMPGSLVNAPSAGYSLDYANVQDEMRRWLALSLKPSWISRIETAFRAVTGDPTIYLDPAELLEVYVSLSADPEVTVPDLSRAARSIPRKATT